MEGSRAEPSHNDLGKQKSWPQINLQVNLSEFPLAIPAPKGHASAAKTKPTKFGDSESAPTPPILLNSSISTEGADS